MNELSAIAGGDKGPGQTEQCLELAPFAGGVRGALDRWTAVVESQAGCWFGPPPLGYRLAHEIKLVRIAGRARLALAGGRVVGNAGAPGITGQCTHTSSLPEYPTP